MSKRISRMRKRSYSVTVVKKNTAILIVLFFILGVHFLIINNGYGQSTTEETNVTGALPSQAVNEPVAVRDQFNIPIDPLADGKAYEVTLYRPEVGTLPWAVGEDSICDLLFKAPGDKAKWLKLNIKKREHFKGFYVGIDDYSGGLSSDVIAAENFKATDQIRLRTRSFKADINVIEARIGSDPDSENPDEKVFEKVLLRITVAEQ